jgi:hypothetical protein
MKKLLLASVLCAIASAGCHIIGPPSDVSAFDTLGAQVTVAHVGEPVTFTCRGTDPFKIHLYMWDFGDGTITEWDKITIEHTYEKPGTYEVHAMERCPLIFGETCLMRTEWSVPLKIAIHPPMRVADASAPDATKPRTSPASSLTRTAAE